MEKGSGTNRLEHSRDIFLPISPHSPALPPCSPEQQLCSAELLFPSLAPPAGGSALGSAIPSRSMDAWEAEGSSSPGFKPRIPARLSPPSPARPGNGPRNQLRTPKAPPGTKETKPYPWKGQWCLGVSAESSPSARASPSLHYIPCSTILPRVYPPGEPQPRFYRECTGRDTEPREFWGPTQTPPAARPEISLPASQQRSFVRENQESPCSSFGRAK